jgi:hypothetical protein
MYFPLKKFLAALVLTHLTCIAFLNASDSAAVNKIPDKKIETVEVRGAENFWKYYHEQIPEQNEALYIYLPEQNEALYINLDNFIKLLYKYLGVNLDQDYHKNFLAYLHSEKGSKPPNRRDWSGSLQYHFVCYIFQSLALAHKGQLAENQLEHWLSIVGNLYQGDGKWFDGVKKFMWGNLKWFCGRAGDNHFKAGAGQGCFFVRFSKELGCVTLVIFQENDKKPHYFRIRKDAEDQWSLLDQHSEPLCNAETLESLILDWMSGELAEKTGIKLEKLTAPEPPNWFRLYEAEYEARQKAKD